MTAIRSRSRTKTATRVLDVAEALVQARGFNGFSYADVAAELGLTTASLHYHFPGKAELGAALIVRYTERFLAALRKIEASHADALSRLDGFAGLFAEVLSRDRMCLCGMLAADYETLPQEMRSAVVAFFDHVNAWLVDVLEAGREVGELKFEGPAIETAHVLVAGLEGAMLVARPYGSVERFERSARFLLAGISA